MPKLNTNQQFLDWVRTQTKNEKLQIVTLATLGGLSVVQAMAAISMMRLKGRASLFALGTINQESGMRFSSTTIRQMEKKGFLQPSAERIPKCDGRAWAVTPLGWKTFARMECDLRKLVEKVKTDPKLETV